MHYNVHASDQNYNIGLKMDLKGLTNVKNKAY